VECRGILAPRGRAQQLERDDVVELQVAGRVHDPHAARAEHAIDLVAPGEHLSGGQRALGRDGPRRAPTDRVDQVAQHAPLRALPHRYPPGSPSPRTTRWQGITSATGFAAQARATARAAPGLPMASATAP